MIEEILQKCNCGFLLYTKGTFTHTFTAKDKEQNRETFARFYQYLSEECKRDPKLVRACFNQLEKKERDHSLPQIIREDRFLSHYAMGRPLAVAMAKEVIAACSEKRVYTHCHPLHIGFHDKGDHYYDVDATPPGILPKLFTAFRLKADHDLLEKVRYDLRLAASIDDNEERKALTYALLSFSAAYRELDNKILEIPHFTQKGILVAYQCKQHLIAEGVKTITLSAGKNHPSIYLCQGTELWPSQPSVLGSILANFAEHGAASQAYAHSWRRIHKQLRDLTESTSSLPIVLGHSMGGSLALQIALYSHDLIDSSHAYNPPASGERDYLFYKTLPGDIKSKFNVYSNLDDPAFWHIGARIIGKVTLFLGKKRWRYYPVSKWDALFLFPAAIKVVLNIIHSFPAHQRIIPLCENYLAYSLSEQEIACENVERQKRFDYLRFFPKLYDPLKILVDFARRFFRWRMEEEFLRNEIEILALLERDLLDMENEKNREEIKKKVDSLKAQKEELRKKLFLLKK